MDKAQIIRWLEDKKQKADTEYADGMNDGLSFAVSLIENWQDEPITPEALQALGWIKEEANGAFWWEFENGFLSMYEQTIYINLGDGMLTTAAKTIEDIKNLIRLFSN